MGSPLALVPLATARVALQAYREGAPEGQATCTWGGVVFSNSKNDQTKPKNQNQRAHGVQDRGQAGGERGAWVWEGSGGTVAW